MQPEPEPVDTAIGASVALGTPGHAVDVAYHFQIFFVTKHDNAVWTLYNNSNSDNTTDNNNENNDIQ